jgi:hypothetical protein
VDAGRRRGGARPSAHTDSDPYADSCSDPYSHPGAYSNPDTNARADSHTYANAVPLVPDPAAVLYEHELLLVHEQSRPVDSHRDGDLQDDGETLMPRPESRLLTYFRGLHQGRTHRRRPNFARGGGYSVPRVQIGYMLGFMRGRSDYKRAHPLGR